MDLSGGMDPAVDEVAAEQPGPQFMEGTNVWLWDDEGRITLPRIAVDAMGARWDEAHMISANAALPGGPVFVVRGSAPPHPAKDEQGQPRVRGAGPLRFECHEPFRRWRVTFDGLAGETTTDEQIAHRFGGPSAIPEPTVRLRFDIGFEMTVAPWVKGSSSFAPPPETSRSTARRSRSAVGDCGSTAREPCNAATTPTGWDTSGCPPSSPAAVPLASTTSTRGPMDPFDSTRADYSTKARSSRRSSSRRHGIRDGCRTAKTSRSPSAPSAVTCASKVRRTSRA